MNVTKSRFDECKWMLRPGVALDVTKSGVSVLIDGENVGELDVDSKLISILPDLAAYTGEISYQGKMLEQFADHRYESADITQLFDDFVRAGLAVRFSAAIENIQASYISQWTSHVDSRIKHIRESRVLLIRGSDLAQKLIHALSDWGIGIETAAVESIAAFESIDITERRPALIIALDIAQDVIRGLSRWCIDNEIPLLPMQSREQQTDIGPLFIRDTSPCPFCSLVDPLISMDLGSVPFGGTSTGWSHIANVIADFLSRRPGSDALFQRHVVANDGRYLCGYYVLIDPRCPICSRLNRFPENSIIYG